MLKEEKEDEETPHKRLRQVIVASVACRGVLDVDARFIPRTELRNVLQQQAHVEAGKARVWEESTQGRGTYRSMRRSARPGHCSSCAASTYCGGALKSRHA